MNAQFVTAQKLKTRPSQRRLKVDDDVFVAFVDVVFVAFVDVVVFVAASDAVVVAVL